jgi:hypothetical protein
LSSIEAPRNDPAIAALRTRILHRVEVGICLIVIAYIIVLVFNLAPLSRDAAFFPKIILVCASLLALLKLASLVSPRARRLFEPELFIQAQALPETEIDETILEEDKGVPAWAAWSWLLTTMLLIIAVGILIGSGIACFAYIYMSAKRSLIPALATAAITVLFLYLVFVEAMRVELGFGMLDWIFT